MKATNSNAEPPSLHMGYLGLALGANTTIGSNENASPTYALVFGANISPEFGIGFFGSHYGQSSSGSLFGLPTGTTTSTLILAIQANYFFNGAHLGGEIGTAISSWSGHISTVNAGDSASAVIFGPQAGYDFLVGQSISLGIEGHYLFTSAKDGVTNAQILGSVKFWQ